MTRNLLHNPPSWGDAKRLPPHRSFGTRTLPAHVVPTFQPLDTPPCAAPLQLRGLYGSCIWSRTEVFEDVLVLHGSGGEVGDIGNGDLFFVFDVTKRQRSVQSVAENVA